MRWFKRCLHNSLTLEFGWHRGRTFWLLCPSECCTIRGDGVVARVVCDHGWEALAGFVGIVADPEQIDIEGLVGIQTGAGRRGGVDAAPIWCCLVVTGLDRKLTALSADLNADVALVVWVFALPVADEFALHHGWFRRTGILCRGASKETRCDQEAGPDMERLDSS
jgi:hypothetical protein